VLTHPFSWKRASMAAGLCYGVGGGGCGLFFHVQPGSYDTVSLIEVLKQLRSFLGGEKATLLWDGLPAHRSKAMAAFVADRVPRSARRVRPARPDRNDRQVR
jgi:hypothetical protein